MNKSKIFSLLLLLTTSTTATNLFASKSLVNCDDSLTGRFVNQALSIVETDNSYQVTMKPSLRGEGFIFSIERLRDMLGIYTIYLTFPKDNCNLDESNNLSCSAVSESVRDMYMFVEQRYRHLDDYKYVINDISSYDPFYKNAINFGFKPNPDYKDRYTPKYLGQISLPTGLKDGIVESWTGEYYLECSFNDDDSLLNFPDDLTSYVDKMNNQEN